MNNAWSCGPKILFLLPEMEKLSLVRAHFLKGNWFESSETLKHSTPGLVKFTLCWVPRRGMLRRKRLAHLFLSKVWEIWLPHLSPMHLQTWLKWPDPSCLHLSQSVLSVPLSRIPWYCYSPARYFSRPPGFCISIPIRSLLTIPYVLFREIFQVKL